MPLPRHVVTTLQCASRKHTRRRCRSVGSPGDDPSQRLRFDAGRAAALVPSRWIKLTSMRESPSSPPRRKRERDHRDRLNSSAPAVRASASVQVGMVVNRGHAATSLSSVMFSGIRV